MNKYEFPEISSCLSILEKLGVDENSVDINCQDWEYTIPNEELLSNYVNLYKEKETTDLEKRVLGCFIIQSIENLLPKNINEKEIKLYLNILSNDLDIHKVEFNYWYLSKEHNQQNWFHITKYIRELSNA